MGLLDWGENLVEGAEHTVGQMVDSAGSAISSMVTSAEHAVGYVAQGGAQLIGDGLNAVGLQSAAQTVDKWGEQAADTMGDQVAEQQLGQTNDPTELVHGDVTAIQSAVTNLKKFSSAFGETATGLGAVDTSHWTGDAADAFRAKFAPQPKNWSNAQEATSAAADALSSYAQTVSWAQGQAKQAIDLYNKGQQETQQAQQQYQQSVDSYNSAAQQYNSAIAAGDDPGAAPTQPGPFTDPGAALRQQAQTLLDQARQQRDSSGQQAQTAISSATNLAPQEPSFSTQLMDDISDANTALNIGAEHFVGGIAKGTLGIVKFARSLNPMDPYNITHPSEYVDGLSNTAAGLVHAALHPTTLVKAVVGTGWGSDPFEAMGNLVPNIALAVATDGAGTAADVGVDVAERTGLGVAEDVGERGAVNTAQDASEQVASDVRPTDVRDPARDGDVKDFAGEPIDPATGSLLMDVVDVDLPGTLPLVIGRHHGTSYRAGRWFGPTWTSVLDERVELDQRGIVFTRGDGVILCYPRPVSDEPVLPEEGARWPLALRPDGGYTITDPRGRLVRHFPRGRAGVFPLAAIEDRNGHRIAFHHTSDGTPISVHHDGGYHLKIDTADGRITALHLMDGDTAVPLVRYGYTRGHLTAVVDSSDQPSRFDYDDVGRLTRWTDRNDLWYRYTYDARGRCVHETGPDDVWQYTFDYDDEHRTTTVTDSLGAVTKYEINDALQVVAVTDALGGVTRKDWDRYDRLLAQTDPLGRTTSFTYDDAGHVVAITRPDGSQALAEYDDAGLANVIVDADGAVWRQEFDDRGNRTALIDPAGARTEFTVDMYGHLRALTDPLGAREVIDTDPAGLPIAITDATGATTRYRRDRFGRVVAIIDPIGSVTRMGWTTEGLLAWREDSGGARETWTYDGEGNLVEHRDRVGGTTRTEYACFNVPSAAVRPDGTRLEFGYDTELRLVSVTNPQGLVWSYDYDPVGRIVGETDFDGRALRYRLDAAGQLVERVNGAGEVLRYHRDPLGNVVELRPGTGPVTSFHRDPMGRITHATSPDAELSYRRDPLGRVLAETVNGRTMMSRYDAMGRRLTRVTPGGTTSTWTYDPVGRPLTLTTAGQTVSFERDVLGREQVRRLGTGATLAQDWDGNHRLRAQTLVGATAQVLRRRTYNYRADDYLVSIDDRMSGRREFDLDPAGRVTGVRGRDWSERYAYDAAGNVTAAQWPTDPSGDATGQRSYAGTRLRRAGRISYQHDAQGRIVMRRKATLSGRQEAWHYEWDAQDRLRSVGTPDGQRWRYRYDPFGRRIAKQRMAADGATVAEQVDFTWDGDLLAEQTTVDPAANVRSTTWDYANGYQPVAQSERIQWRDAPQPWVDQRFYGIVTDLIGTPTELVDADGTVAWHATSTLWGNTTYRSIQTDTPLRFPGQYFDAETGLHYNYNRYYDPTTGRYASPDPLGLAPSPNPVAYVHNPTTWADPLGLAGTGCMARPPLSSGDGTTVYRNLRPDEDPSVGLSAKDPDATYMPGGHITNGSKPGFQSQYISTTTDPAVAAKWYSGNAVAIDTSQYSGTVIDASTQAARDAAGIRGATANRLAESSKEVLLTGADVPPSAMKPWSPP